MKEYGSSPLFVGVHCSYTTLCFILESREGWKGSIVDIASQNGSVEITCLGEEAEGGFWMKVLRWFW